MTTYWITGNNDKISRISSINPRYSIYITAIFDKTNNCGAYIVKPIVTHKEVSYIVDLNTKAESIKFKNYEEFFINMDSRLRDTEVIDVLESGVKTIRWPNYQLWFSLIYDISKSKNEVLIEFDTKHFMDLYNAESVLINLDGLDKNDTCTSTFFSFPDGSYEKPIEFIELVKAEDTNEIFL